MIRFSLLVCFLGLSLSASATPEVTLADNVDYSSCGSDTVCKGQLVNATYNSLVQELAGICQSRGYKSYFVRKTSSRTIGNSVTRITVTGYCRNQ